MAKRKPPGEKVFSLSDIDLGPLFDNLVVDGCDSNPVPSVSGSGFTDSEGPVRCTLRIDDGTIRRDDHKGVLYIPKQARGPSINDIASIYASTAKIRYANNVDGMIDANLRGLVDIVWSEVGRNHPEVQYESRPLAEVTGKVGGKTLCAVSGGLRSTGLMINLLESGHDVIAFNIAGLNKATHDKPERDAARAICEKLKVEFRQVWITNSLECEHSAHPLLPVLLYAIVLEQAAKLETPSIALGYPLGDPSRSGEQLVLTEKLLASFKWYADRSRHKHSLYTAVADAEAEKLVARKGLTSILRSCDTDILNFNRRRSSFQKSFPNIDTSAWPNCCFKCRSCCRGVVLGLDAGTRKYGVPKVEKELRKHCEEVLSEM